jgi:hypothetical protein
MATAIHHSHLTVSRHNRLTTFDSACLIAGQLAMCASTFFWNADGSYSVNSATIIILSMLFWAVGLQGVFGIFKDENPWYSRLGLLYAMYGCLGGIAFGFDGLFSEILQSESKIGLSGYERFPLQMNLVLFWSGPAFPLSMLILGGFLIYGKKATVLTGILLIVGAIAFPLSRILRMELMAHLADAVLLAGITLLVVGKPVMSQSASRTTQ